MSALIPGLILVRTNSTRLPRKCFLPFGEGTVIEHLIRRAAHFGFDPVICTTAESSDDELFARMKRLGVKVFRGSTEDKIRRLHDACAAFGIARFVTIDADDPFFDPAADAAAFQLLDQGFDFITPPDDYYCGSVGCAVTKDILQRAIRERDTAHSEMMWAIIEKLPGIKTSILKINNDRMSRIRLTLDYPEDYDMLLVVLRLLGPLAQAQDIEELFQRNPDIHKINWFRQEQWKENQQRVISSY